MIPTAPAILNAVTDATGVRIRQLPATREHVLEALRGAARGSGSLLNRQGAKDAKGRAKPRRRPLRLVPSMETPGDLGVLAVERTDVRSLEVTS